MAVICVIINDLYEFPYAPNAIIKLGKRFTNLKWSWFFFKKKSGRRVTH